MCYNTPLPRGGGGEVVQITYQKANGCVIQRLRNTMLPYKVGDTTSMGWKVLNIEYEYNNKFYSEYEYNTLVQKKHRSQVKRQQTIESFIKEFKTFFYYLMAIVLINLLKSVLGI